MSQQRLAHNASSYMSKYRLCGCKDLIFEKMTSQMATFSCRWEDNGYPPANILEDNKAPEISFATWTNTIVDERFMFSRRIFVRWPCVGEHGRESASANLVNFRIVSFWNVNAETIFQDFISIQQVTLD